MNARSTVERFLAAFYSGDVNATRQTITEDFTLVGPFATAHSADEFFDLAQGLLNIVRGHNVLRCVVENSNVAALYQIILQGPAGEGVADHRRLVHRDRRTRVGRPADLRHRSV